MPVEPVATDDLNPVAFAIELFTATKVVLQLLWRIFPEANCREMIPVSNGRGPEHLSVHGRSNRVIDRVIIRCPREIVRNAAGRAAVCRDDYGQLHG
jgi:hypothetical protein